MRAKNGKSRRSENLDQARRDSTEKKKKATEHISNGCVVALL